MKKLQLMKSIVVLLVAVSLALSFTASADDSSHSEGSENAKNKHAPDNLIKAMTFVSSRPFNSVDGTFFKNGLFGTNGDNFFKNVMGLSTEEIENRRKSAIKFFAQRFGIDVNDPKVYFTSFEVDTAIDYRAIMVTGEDPKKGYPILDGGFIVAVLDPAGLDLGGEFSGTHVPAGTMFAAGGNYVVKRNEHKRNDIVIDYQSRGPMQPVGAVGGIVNCELSHPKWGKGLGWGYFEIHQLSNGQTSSQVRNVMSFPGLGIEETLLTQ